MAKIIIKTTHRKIMVAGKKRPGRNQGGLHEKTFACL